MLSESSTAAEPAVLDAAVCRAIEAGYRESGAERFDISLNAFRQLVAAVVHRYAKSGDSEEQLELLGTLRIEELVLARACAAGNEAAWDVFLNRYRARLYESACCIARDDASGRELADGLYAELFGLPNREGRRVSKLDYYMGRGSLEGWLRTVLAQRFVDRCRSYGKDVSLEEQVEQGASFAALDVPVPAAPDRRVAIAVERALAELPGEERFLLAAYFLDRWTLAAIGRHLGMHESTVSRRLEKRTTALRKSVRRHLLAAGVAPRRCDELMMEIDVRDLKVDIRANLGQDRKAETF